MRNAGPRIVERLHLEKVIKNKNKYGGKNLVKIIHQICRIVILIAKVNKNIFHFFFTSCGLSYIQQQIKTHSIYVIDIKYIVINFP